jgi:predicted ribosome-associated RNA-binding protein Tma20
MTLQCYSDAKWQYTLHQDTNRAKIVTYEKDIVCLKSSGKNFPYILQVDKQKKKGFSS